MTSTVAKDVHKDVSPNAHSAPSQLTAANPSPPPAHSDIDIDAIIQMATRTSATSSTGKDTRTQLFVGNLPYRVRWQDLKDLFRKAGTVLRADVSLGPDNRSRGYGTVLLASAEDAGRAIDMFNGYSWQTRTLEVRHDRIAPEFDINYPLSSIHSSMGYAPSNLPHNLPMPPNSATASLFPLSANPTLEHLRSSSMNGSLSAPSLGAPLLNSGGTASSILNPASPSFASMSAANQYTSLSHSRSGSRMGSHMSITPNGQSRNVFVGNLPFQCQWQDLKDLFRRAGSIVRADVALGPDGRSRGYGTVLFANESDASRAVAMFNGQEYNSRVLKVHHDKFTQSSTPPPFSASLAPPPLQHQSSSSYFGNIIPSNAQYSSSSAAAAASVTSPYHNATLMQTSSRPPSPFDPYPLQLQHNPYSAPPMTTAQANSYQDLLAHWASVASAPQSSQVHAAQLLQQQIEALSRSAKERLSSISPVPGSMTTTSSASKSSSVASISSPPPSSQSSLITPLPLMGGGTEIEKRSKEIGILRVHSDDLHHAPSLPAVPPIKTSTSDESGAAITKSKIMTPPSKRMSRSPSSGQGTAHPGPITLPPPAFSPPRTKSSNNTSSAEEEDDGETQNTMVMSPVTRGLPPMTPSMPGFTFHPQTATPPLYPHFLSPGIGQFSPPRDAGAVGGPNSSQFYPSNASTGYHPGLMMAVFGMHSPPIPVVNPSQAMGMLSPGGIVPVPMTPGVPMTPQPSGAAGGNGNVSGSGMGIPMTPGHPIHPRMYGGSNAAAAGGGGGSGYGELGSPSRGIGVYPQGQAQYGASASEGYFPPVVATTEERNEYFPPILDERVGNTFRRSSESSSTTTGGGAGSGSGSGTGTLQSMSSVEGNNDDVRVVGHDDDSDRERVRSAREEYDSKMDTTPSTPSASMLRTSSDDSGGSSGNIARSGGPKWMSQKKDVGMKLEGVPTARVGLLGLGDGLPVVSPGRRASFAGLRTNDHHHPILSSEESDSHKEAEVKQSSR